MQGLYFKSFQMVCQLQTKGYFNMNISILDQKSAKIVNWPPRYLGSELMIYLFLLWSSESGVREDTLYKANEGLRLVKGGVLLVYVHQQLPLSCRNGYIVQTRMWK